MVNKTNVTSNNQLSTTLVILRVWRKAGANDGHVCVWVLTACEEKSNYDTSSKEFVKKFETAAAADAETEVSVRWSEMQTNWRGRSNSSSQRRRQMHGDKSKLRALELARTELIKWPVFTVCHRRRNERQNLLFEADQQRETQCPYFIHFHKKAYQYYAKRNSTRCRQSHFNSILKSNSKNTKIACTTILKLLNLSFWKYQQFRNQFDGHRETTTRIGPTTEYPLRNL